MRAAANEHRRRFDLRSKEDLLAVISRHRNGYIYSLYVYLCAAAAAVRFVCVNFGRKTALFGTGNCIITITEYGRRRPLVHFCVGGSSNFFHSLDSYTYYVQEYRTHTSL